MRAPELSMYPTDYDTDQRRLDQLVQRREAAVDTLGSLAILAVSGGTLEAGTPDKLETAETSPAAPTTTVRNIGNVAMTSLITDLKERRNASEIAAAIASQDNSQLTQHAYDLAA